VEGTAIPESAAVLRRDELEMLPARIAGDL
jgi:hypothetical protein